MSDNQEILLARWLEGSISDEELNDLKQEVDLDALQVVLNTQEQLDIVHKPEDEMWEGFEKRRAEEQEQQSPQKPKRPWWFYLVVALIAIIGSMLIARFLLLRGTTIETPAGVEQEQLFADNTKVRISPGSWLHYDEADWSVRRDLELQGQAYFEVEKGAPFTVATPNGQVQVLGTRFDVWSMGELMRVQCFEGRVKVNRGKSNGAFTLEAGQEITLNKSGFGPVKNIIQQEANWLNKQQVYTQIPVELVIKDLERFYDRDIEASLADLSSEFSGVLPLDDLDKALDYLSKTMNWTYEDKDSYILLSPK